MVLLLQIDENPNSAELIFDKEGLGLLRDILNKKWRDPISKGGNMYDLDHEHLSSKEWGGDELTPEFSSPDTKKIQTLKVTYVGEKGEEFLGD